MIWTSVLDWSIAVLFKKAGETWDKGTFCLIRGFCVYANVWAVAAKKQQGIHPKEHRCHPSNVTQMLPECAQEDVDAFGQWKKSAFHPSVHTVNNTSGSSLGAQNNKKETKKEKLCSGTFGDVVERCMYKCIGFAASYSHKSIYVFICYALKKLWYRV